MGPNVDPKQQGSSYEDTHKKNPQWIETGVVLLLWMQFCALSTPDAAARTGKQILSMLLPKTLSMKVGGENGWGAVPGAFEYAADSGVRTACCLVTGFQCSKACDAEKRRPPDSLLLTLSFH